MKKSYLIVTHLLFWILSLSASPYMFMVPFWMLTHRLQYPDPPKGPYYLEIDYPALLIFFAVGALIFYSSYFSLKFFMRRPLRFIWVALAYLIPMLTISLPADLISRQAVTYLAPVLYFNLSGFVFKAIDEWVRDRKRSEELEQSRIRTQLELLQSKIDPHFLFNNLNNIDALIPDDPQRASMYLRKLSDILRFMLYETQVDKIPLETELDYIRKFIDLQKIRTSNPDFVLIEVTGDPTGKKISPMLLIHFIENAFKFAGNKKIRGAVQVKITIASSRLLFTCRNHVHNSAEQEPMTKGIGLRLLKQKMDLLFNKDYRLEVKNENNWYLVTLDMPIDEN